MYVMRIGEGYSLLTPLIRVYLMGSPIYNKLQQYLLIVLRYIRFLDAIILHAFNLFDTWCTSISKNAT